MEARKKLKFQRSHTKTLKKGLLKHLRNKMSSKTFKLIAEGLFTSPSRYCMQVFGNIWGVETLDETSRRFSCFGKEDCQKLQVLQNKVLKLQTGLPNDCPTIELMKETGSFSVHQLMAFHTLVQVHKIVINQKPKYLAEKLKLKTSENNGKIFPHKHSNKINVNCELSLSRAAFVHRGAQIFNSLPLPLRSCKNSDLFKKEATAWVKTHISIKPN